MKNELEKIKHKYLKPNNYYGYYSKIIAKKLLKILNNAICCERPDFYYIESDICYICEHFEFDASINKAKKGSMFKRAEHQTRVKIKHEFEDKMTNNPPSETEISNYGAISKGIHYKQDKNSWKSNFISAFDNHYLKIEDYRNNLISKKIINDKTIIKYIFIIEDTTIFGAFKNIKMDKICYPFDFSFGIDVLQKAKRVNYFIFLNESQEELFFVNRSSFNKMKKYVLNFEKTKMFFLNDVKLVSAKITVPDSIFEKTVK